MDHIAELNGSRLAVLLEKAGIRGRQIAEAFQFTKDSIVHVLKEELKKGNLQEVLAILKGKPMAAGKSILKAEITGRVVKGLMLKFGLRRIVAIGIAAILIPFIIAKLAQKLLQGRNVPDLIHSLNLKMKFQEIFTARATIQPAPEPVPASATETFESEFLTD